MNRRQAMLLLLSLTVPGTASAARSVTVRLLTSQAPNPFDCVEFAVDIEGATYTNPFDPEDIAVEAKFIDPKGQTLTVPAFWYAPYRRQPGSDGSIGMAPVPDGKPGFRLRFAPPTIGQWKMSVTAKDRMGAATSETLSFTVSLPEPVTLWKQGLVRRAPGSRYFQFDRGDSYFLIGENVCWSGKRGLADYDDWFGALGKAGGNFARLWMAFSPIESKDSGLGRYDLKNAAYFDEILQLAERNGIRCMLAFGTYGEFNTGGFFNEGQWPNNPYSAANGGPVPADKPNDFFTNETARKLYRQRLRYLVARYSAYTSLAFWEFWNEKEGPAAWFSEMAKFIRAIDPHQHLITNSYPTTGPAEVWNIPEIDLTQTHRYGDEGSIRDIAPLILRDARDHDALRKPHLMGEFGISWRGSDDKFDPKGIGTNLHNGLWSSALSGAAGGAAIWWWDSYVHPKNLYGSFKALAAFASGIDWAKRDFKPLTLDTPTAAGSGPETFHPAVLSPDGAWGVTQSEPAILRPDGELSGGGLPGFLYGSDKKEMQKPMRLRVTLGKPSQLRVQVSTVSTRANLRVSVDGKQVAEFPFDASPDGPKGYESTKQFPEYGGIYQAIFNKVVSVPLPAGSHEVTLENTVGDWLSLGTITVENARSSRYIGLRTAALRDAAEEETLFWIQDKESNWYNDRVGETPRRISGAKVILPIKKRGLYKLEWRDTRTGTIVDLNMLTFSQKSPPPGGVEVRVPEFTRDIAARVRLIAPES
jgi:hypothetical protein